MSITINIYDDINNFNKGKNNINEEDCDKIVKIQELQNVPTDSNKNISNAIKVNLIALRDKYCKST